MSRTVIEHRYCDVCGKEIEDREYMTVRVSEIPDSIGGRRTKIYDVCKDCSRKVRTVFNGQGNAEDEDE